MFLTNWQANRVVPYLNCIATSLQKKLDSKPSESLQVAIGKILVYCVQAVAEQLANQPDGDHGSLLELVQIILTPSVLHALSASVPISQRDIYFSYFLDNTLAWILRHGPNKVYLVFEAQRHHMQQTCLARHFDMV